nr:hypothetical protein [Paenibacillus sp. JNUCC-31]
MNQRIIMHIRVQVQTQRIREFTFTVSSLMKRAVDVSYQRALRYCSPVTSSQYSPA